MVLQPGDIEKALNNYRESRSIASPLVDFVVSNMLRNIDMETSRIFDDDEAIAVELKSTTRNVIPVIFVFWLEDDRFSLFIEDKEVIDEYFKDTSDVQKAMLWITTILSNPIVRVRFMRNGKLRKVIYTYSAMLENGAVEKHEDESVVAITLPWHKNERSEHLFDAWLPNK